MKYRFVLILVGLLVVNCGTKKGIATKKSSQKNQEDNVKVVVTDKEINKETKTVIDNKTDKDIPVKTPKAPAVSDKTLRYVETYAEVAKDEMRMHNIPASITLAQGILESSSGNGRLALKANNHFGIKCHGWKGAKIYHDDDKSQECFRKYKKPMSSYKDHSKFLTQRGRYSKLFKLQPNDYKAWARGLKAAGYATDRAYANKLINLIERYKLYKYDDAVLGVANKDKSQDKKTKSITHTVNKGDTLYSLSKRYNTKVEHIMALNKLQSTHLNVEQRLIIIPNKL